MRRAALCGVSAVILSAIVAACGQVEAADGGRRVHFLDGRTMDVVAYHVEAADAVLTLPHGVIAIPLSQVVRVEELAPSTTTEAVQPAQSAPQPLPVPAEKTAGSQASAPAQPVPESETEMVSRLIREAAGRYDLEVDLLAAVVAVESGRNPGAVSPKGAQGLMQLMPETAQDLAVSNPFDPAQNIDAGARYLRQLLDLHQDSYTNALAAYNAGPGRVSRWKGVPPFKETQRYVHRVLQQYAAPASH